MQFKIDLPGVKLGVVEADGVAVRMAGAEQIREMDRICAALQAKYETESLANAAPIVAVRGMFRGWGVDASKYRPSSEALLRRVAQGKGLYHVSNVVDLTNIGSIETSWPCGVYDRTKISPPVCLRHGTAEEKYEGIGKRMWHLARQPVLADSAGPFGSPISDSTRTQIVCGVSEVLTVIYIPAAALGAAATDAMDKQAKRLAAYAGAGAVRTYLIS